LTLLSNICYYR